MCWTVFPSSSSKHLIRELVLEQGCSVKTCRISAVVLWSQRSINTYKILLSTAKLPTRVPHTHCLKYTHSLCVFSATLLKCASYTPTDDTVMHVCMAVCINIGEQRLSEWLLLTNSLEGHTHVVWLRGKTISAIRAQRLSTAKDQKKKPSCERNQTQSHNCDKDKMQHRKFLLLYSYSVKSPGNVCRLKTIHWVTFSCTPIMLNCFLCVFFLFLFSSEI